VDSEILLDVRELAAPEPLQRVIAALETLAPGQYVRMLHRRDAHCLRQTLASLGFDHWVEQPEPGRFEFAIWRADDQDAALAAQRRRQP